MTCKLRPHVPDTSIQFTHPLDPHPVTLIEMHVTGGSPQCPLPVDEMPSYVSELFIVSVNGTSDVTVRGLDGCRESIDTAGCCGKHPCERIEATPFV